MKDIKVLGTGCPKCKTLERMTREVVEKNGIDATITKVEDILEIMTLSNSKGLIPSHLCGMMGQGLLWDSFFYQLLKNGYCFLKITIIFVSSFYEILNSYEEESILHRRSGENSQIWESAGSSGTYFHFGLFGQKSG